MIALGVLGAALAAYYLRSPLPPPTIVGSKQLTSDGNPKMNLVTDGNRLYFTEFSGNHFIVAHVSAAGGESATIPAGQISRIVRLKDMRRFFPPLSGTWSGLAPDGSPIVVRDISTQEIYALDLRMP